MSLHNQTKKRLTACLTLLACGAALFPASVGAAGGVAPMSAKEMTYNANEQDPVVSGRMSLGLANGQSGEYVYNPRSGRKVSDLQWGIDSVYMLGLGGSVSPLSWLKVNADVWFKLNDGSGKMDDYDFMIPNYQYTDWSHHNVDLTTGLLFDINAEITFYRWAGSKFFGIAGFKHDDWEWEAKGGNYIYSTYSLYDTVGNFPDDTKVITYEQKFNTPYIGIGFSSNLNPTPITFSGRLIASTLVSAEDKDQHHLRDIVFEEKFDSGRMVGFDLGGAYNFTKNFSLMLAYHYQKYDEMKGETTQTDLTTGKITKYTGEVAGIDNDLSIVSFSAIVSF